MSVQGQQSPRMHDISPEPVAHLSQHRLVPMLLECVSGKEMGSKVLFDSTVLEVRQSGDTVKAVTKTSQVCQRNFFGSSSRSFCGRHTSHWLEGLVSGCCRLIRIQMVSFVVLRAMSSWTHLLNASSKVLYPGGC